MTSPRASLGLTIIAILLGTAVFLFDRRENESIQPEASRVFPDLSSDPGQVSSIGLTTAQGAKVRIERRGGRWWVVEPIEAPARNEVLESLAEELVALQSEAVIDSPQPLSVYGLEDEAKDIRFGVDGGQRVLRIGRRTPVGSNAYVTTEQNGAVWLVSSHRVDRFSRDDLDGLRDARVLVFDAPRVHRVTVRGASSVPVVLERDVSSWRIVSPIEDPANASQVEGLLSTLSFLRAKDFVDRPEPAQRAALAEPETAITLDWGPPPGTLGEEGRSHFAAALGNGGGERLVRGDRDAIFRVDAERLFELPRELGDFRDKELALFDPVDVVFYEAIFRPVSGGAITVGMERTSDGWRAMTPGSMAAGAPSRALSALAQLEASEIIAEEAGPREWAGWGLQPPAVTYRIYGASGEDGRPQLLAEVDFGESHPVKGTMARRPEDSRLYRVAPGLGRHLPLHYGAFLEEFRSREEGVPAGS